MARCFICDYCDTVDEEPHRQVRFVDKTKEYICSECEGSIMDALSEFGIDEEDDKSNRKDRMP